MINSNLLMMAQQFRQNPVQLLSQKYSIPQNVNSPQDILQHLLNTGQVTQNQVNSAMQMRNNPMVQQLMNR